MARLEATAPVLDVVTGPAEAVVARSVESSDSSQTLNVLAVTALTAAVDPAREAYLQQFRDADPNAIYWTPATPGYAFYPTPITEEQYRAFIADHVARTGTSGFSQTTSGALQYTNRLNQDVAVLYGPVAAGVAEPTGIRIVRPGQTIVLPYPSGGVASAQVPRTGSVINEVAVAAVGYPPFTKPPVGNVPSPLQLLVDNVRRVVTELANNTARLVQQVLTNVQQVATNLQTAVDTAIAELQWNLKASAPSNVGDLYLHLRDVTASAPDSIYIEKIQTQRVGGEVRFIVYIGGTTGNWVGNNQSVITNLPAYHGDIKQHQVDAIKRAIGENATAKVMLVGYSQGGLDAQNLAASGKFNVTTVVTYGSPINQPAPDPDKYRIVHLRADLDPVPGIMLNDYYRLLYIQNRDVGNIYTTRPANVNFWYLLQDPWGDKLHGDRATYDSVGDKFDQNPGYQDVKFNISRFRGKIV